MGQNNNLDQNKKRYAPTGSRTRLLECLQEHIVVRLMEVQDTNHYTIGA